RTILYRARKGDCSSRQLKPRCTRNVAFRKVPRDVHEDARDATRALMGTPEYSKLPTLLQSARQRQKQTHGRNPSDHSDCCPDWRRVREQRVTPALDCVVQRRDGENNYGQCQQRQQGHGPRCRVHSALAASDGSPRRAAYAWSCGQDVMAITKKRFG